MFSIDIQFFQEYFQPQDNRSESQPSLSSYPQQENVPKVSKPPSYNDPKTNRISRAYFFN